MAGNRSESSDRRALTRMERRARPAAQPTTAITTTANTSTSGTLLCRSIIVQSEVIRSIMLTFWMRVFKSFCEFDPRWLDVPPRAFLKYLSRGEQTFFFPCGRTWLILLAHRDSGSFLHAPLAVNMEMTTISIFLR